MRVYCHNAIANLWQRRQEKGRQGMANNCQRVPGRHQSTVQKPREGQESESGEREGRHLVSTG